MALALALLALTIVVLFSGLVLGALRQHLPRRLGSPVPRAGRRGHWPGP